CEVLHLPRIRTKVNEKPHQAGQKLILRCTRRADGFVKDPQDVAQLFEHFDSALEVLQIGLASARALELSGVRKAIKRREQLVKNADGPPGIEVTVTFSQKVDR